MKPRVLEARCHGCNKIWVCATDKGDGFEWVDRKENGCMKCPDKTQVTILETKE